MKVTKVAINKIYPIVEKSLQKNTPAYKKNVQEFIKDRSKDLYDIVPVRRIPFGSEDIDSFFKAMKIDKNEITQCLSETYYWNMNFNPRAAKDEFTMTMMMVIRYFLLKNKQTDAEISTIYLAFSGKFYPSIHSQKFKIPPEKYRHIMEYVLNNVLTQETYYWNMNFNPRAAKDEFTMTMMMVIRYFLLKNKQTDAEISTIYLAFSGKFYPSIHSQKFKIPPEKYRHIMEYVLNNVLTQKYDLKREGSVFGAVRSICKTWLRTYTPKFKNPDDEDVADMIQQLHGRIKSFLGNIAAAYYDTYEKRDTYFAYASDSNDQDSFRIADNDSLLAERCVENAMNWITTKQVDYKLCKWASDKNVKVDEIKSIIESIQEDSDNLILIREMMQLIIADYFSISICKWASDKNVKVDEIKSIIESIQEDSDNLILIREMMQLIIADYFSISKTKDVTSYEFINKSIVAKPNSKNKYVIRQKEIIEYFLDENSPAYRKRKSRPDTKSSYYKSILTYYVLVINESNK